MQPIFHGCGNAAQETPSNVTDWQPARHIWGVDGCERESVSAELAKLLVTVPEDHETEERNVSSVYNMVDKLPMLLTIQTLPHSFIVGWKLQSKNRF